MLVEYAKAAPDDILIRISATNRGPDPAPLHLLPTLWFRNTWAWGRDDRRPRSAWRRIPQRRHRRRVELRATAPGRSAADRLVYAHHHALGEYWLACAGHAALLFTENETQRRSGCGDARTSSPYVKDGIHDAVVHGDARAP